jgi:Uma2 family endonuclease
MSSDIQTEVDPEVAELLAPFEHLDLAEEDGIPLESAWHRDCMNLLIASVLHHQRDRADFYVGGNMFIYFNLQQARDRDFRGPDFFLVQGGVNLHPNRRYWAVWDEGGRYPDVIIELLSRSTADLDRTTKKSVYEQTFRTSNYFCYDPTTQKLEGWSLQDGHYQSLEPNEQGRLWCSVLGLWVGPWQGEYHRQPGTWMRFFDQQGKVIPVEEEAQRHLAEEEHRLAEKHRRLAEEHQRRAEAAEAELVRMRALLAKQTGVEGTSG